MRRLSPASASIAIHTEPKMIVEPKSGCSIRKTATKPTSPPDSQNTGSALVLFLERQQPGHRDDEEGLQEFGRLQLADAKLEPAHRAILLRADERHDREQDEEDQRAAEREAARALARHHRDEDHHRQRHRDPHDLAVEEEQFVDPHRAARIALRRGGRGGGDRDQPDPDQHRDHQQQDAVDLPEPAPRRRAVRAPVAARIGQRGGRLDPAGEALGRQRSGRARTIHNASTAARNASPRASKSVNWSNEAQAGDSSTVSPGSASAAAAFDRRVQRPALGHRDLARRAAAARTSLPPRRWYRPCAHGRSAARIRRAFRLGLPADDPAHSRERRQAPAPPPRHWSPCCR